MKRIFNLTLGAFAMLAVALLSAFISMRLAIHGREVEVPRLTGLSFAEAQKQTSALGLRLTLEDSFYSPHTPAGSILAQSPSPGVTVRHEWPVRITASLGPQQVAIPTVLGQTERTADINIRRLSLELGVVAQLPVPGEPGVVLAQTPNANAAGVDRPRVSLLVSAPEEPEAPPAFVMPPLTGLTLAAASARAAVVGLHIVSADDLGVRPQRPLTPSGRIMSQTSFPGPSAAPATPEPITLASTVIAQTPASGHRVIKGDAVHITLTN